MDSFVVDENGIILCQAGRANPQLFRCFEDSHMGDLTLVWVRLGGVISSINP
jgi:hypothetical protein